MIYLVWSKIEWVSLHDTSSLELGPPKYIPRWGGAPEKHSWGISLRSCTALHQQTWNMTSLHPIAKQEDQFIRSAWSFATTLGTTRARHEGTWQIFRAKTINVRVPLSQYPEGLQLTSCFWESLQPSCRKGHTLPPMLPARLKANNLETLHQKKLKEGVDYLVIA